MKVLTIKRFAAKDYFPFAVLFILLAFFHIPLRSDFGDDLLGRQIWNEGQVFSSIAVKWNSWGSRVIVGFVTDVFCGLPQIVWKLVNTCVIVLAAVCVSKLLAGDHRYGNHANAHDAADNKTYARTRNVIIAALFLMYNFYEMSSSGWIAATVNYLWPTAAALFVILSVKRVCQAEKKCRAYEYPLIVAALIFASNQEQICAALLAVYLFYIVYAVSKKNIPNRFVLLQFILCAGSLILIFSCPGNQLRYEAEMSRWFPGHDALPLWRKVSIGISSTFNYFALTPQLLFIALSLLLSAGIFVKYKRLKVRIISLTPVLVNLASVVYIFFDFFMTDGVIELKNPRDIFHLYGIAGSQSGLNMWLPHIMYAALAVSFSVCLYLFFKNLKAFALPFGVLALGIASRAMMGLSPTVFASSYRTYLPLCFSFIIAAAVIYREIVYLASPKVLRYINVSIVLVALTNFFAIPAGYEIVKPLFNR